MHFFPHRASESTLCEGLFFPEVPSPPASVLSHSMAPALPCDLDSLDSPCCGAEPFLRSSMPASTRLSLSWNSSKTQVVLMLLVGSLQMLPSVPCSSSCKNQSKSRKMSEYSQSSNSYLLGGCNQALQFYTLSSGKKETRNFDHID